MKVAMGIATLLLAAGCGPVESAANAPASGCAAEKAQGLVGKAATPALLEQAREAAGAQTVRKLLPDQMVTMEYREGRLNVSVDAGDKVVRITCG